MKSLDTYSKEEQQALRTEICVDASDEQINYFLRVCYARGIDPFSGLLYMQRRFVQKTGKWKCAVNPTVDGSRSAASRTGFYAGSDEPEFDDDDAEMPKWCRVTVYRMVKNERFAFTAKCRMREFMPKPPNDFQWKDKPFHMLAKVTEVQALRKAFPESVPAAGEDDFESEVENEPGQQPSPNAQVMVEWTNALQAFAPLGKKEEDLLSYLKITKDKLASEHMDILRSWYEELTRDG